MSAAQRATPSPWTFLEEGRTEEEQNRCKPLTICGPDGDTLASVYSSADATTNVSRDEAIANARVFAAANDLLSALSVAAQVMTRLQRRHTYHNGEHIGYLAPGGAEILDGMHEGPNIDAAISNARAAIAKAIKAADMTTTACWHCNQPYPIADARCPHCCATNANVDAERAQLEVQNPGRIENEPEGRMNAAQLPTHERPEPRTSDYVLIIRTTGVQLVEPLRYYASLYDCVRDLIQAETLDTVDLRDGRTMFVDDNGHAKGKEVNVKATQLYWSVCKPGTTHHIAGDVVLFRGKA